MSNMDITSEKKDLVVGIDILKNSVVVSFATKSISDPVTLTTMGSDAARHIPQAIAKEKGLGRWYIGEDAIQKARTDGAELVEQLFEKAYSSQSVQIEGRDYSHVELFATFLRRVVDETGHSTDEMKKLIITVAEVDERTVELFSAISSHLALSRDVLTIIDHKESFIYYTLSQNQNIHAKDVALFDYESDRVLSCILSKEKNTRPQVIHVDMDIEKISSEDNDSKDRDFSSFIEKVFAQREISSVFLIGDGFQGDWLKDSVGLLCEDRRVFMGDNLYSKGACFAGRIRLGNRPWPYIHMGDHEMKMNLSLKVLKDNEMVFFTLVTAGENWYEAGGECEVILDGTPEFECWVQSPETRKSKVTTIELNKLPKRERRTTRLRISASPISSSLVKLTVRDLGFGDIAPATGMIWEHMIDMVENTEMKEEVKWVN